MSLSTAAGVLRTVFPFNDPTSGPKIRSAARMSARVTGQLGSRFPSMMDRNVLVLGLPIIFCILRANLAFA